MPEQIYREAKGDRDEAIRLLQTAPLRRSESPAPTR
jgi:hypothetical protein